LPRGFTVEAMPRFATALLASLLAGCGAVDSQAAKGIAVEQAFQAFVQKFGRVYSSKQEEQARFAAFKGNYAFIERVNAQGKPYTLAVNEFADQTPQEFGAGRLGLSSRKATWTRGAPHLGTDRYSGAPLADAVDWVAKGAVTPPKNQGQCGSCWAFSTTGSLEGAWQIATGKLVSLSEQQLVDCDKDGNSGCSGGDMDTAYKFLENQTTCTEASYPYASKDGKQCLAPNCKVGIPKGGITGYKDVPQDDTNALMEAVAQQPVSVAIEADQMAFQMYQKGIITKECGAKLDHGVLIVGYGTENGTDYWKVKNSWGASWGEGGYVRIERGVPKAGECGIKSEPTYPVVKGSAAPAVVVV